jgi:hypothetical protein
LRSGHERKRKAETPPPNETLFAAAHHDSTDQPEKIAEMTDSQRSVRARQAINRDELSTERKIFCTKSAQWVYADCFDIRRLLTGGVNR